MSQIKAASAMVRERYSGSLDTKRMDCLLERVSGEQGPVPLKSATKLPADFPPGAVLRVGPNPKFESNRAGWLDGDGMVHCVVLEPADQKAPDDKHDGWYSHAWVRTAAFEKEEKEGEIFWGTISSAPRALPMIAAMIQNSVRGGQVTKDSCNTAVQFHGGKILALMEQCLPSELEVTRGGCVRTIANKCTLDGSIPPDPVTGGALAAHSKADPVTGERMSITYNFNPATARHDVFAPDGSLAHQTTIELPRNTMIHDLAITPKFSVILDLPLTFRPEKILRDRFPIEFEQDAPARIGLIPRFGDADEVQWFDVEAGLCLHTFNAFERADGTVVVQGMRQLPEGASSYITAVTSAFPYEWVLDPATGRCVAEQYLSDVPGEFPTLAPGFVGQPARFGYALSPLSAGPVESYGGTTEAQLFVNVTKYDLFQGGVVESYGLPEGWFFTSEPTFVPKLRPAHAGKGAEDEGYLLVFATQTDGGSGASKERGTWTVTPAPSVSALLVLDAGAAGAGPVARIKLPSAMPYGLHSEFVPWEALAAE